MTPRDGEIQYDRNGDKLGTIHFSTRRRRWFHIIDRVVGPARYMDAQEAADALRKAAGA